MTFQRLADVPAGGRITKTDIDPPRDGGQDFAVGRECQRIFVARRTGAAANTKLLAPGSSVPKTNSLKSKAGEESAIGRVGDSARVHLLEVRELFARRHVPA